MPDILVVCTANVARSPLFATRLQLEANNRLGPGTVEVASAGIDAVFGAPAAAGSRVVGERWDRPLDDHRATPVSYIDLAEVPLVLAMEIAHRRSLIRRERSLAARAFTVRELIRIVLDRIGPEGLTTLPSPDPTDPRRRLAALAELADGHRPGRLARKHADVPDPIRAGQPVYDGLGEEFARAAALLSPALFGPTTA